MLVVLASGGGCTKRGVLFECKRDPMPCEEYGGRVSMRMQGDPVASDQRPVARRLERGRSVPIPAVLPVNPPQPLPPVDAPPLFIAPPQHLNRLRPLPPVEENLQSCLEQDGPVLASYLDCTSDPVYQAVFEWPENSPADSELGAIVPAAAWQPQAPEQFDQLLARVKHRQQRRTGRRRLLAEGMQKVCMDHGNFYSTQTLCGMTYGLALSGVLAHTSLDQDFRDWYQDDVYSTDLNDFASVCKVFGDGWICVPSIACLGVATVRWKDRPIVGPVSEFSFRTTRAYMVGAPPMILTQYALGASRPGERHNASHWRPFQDANGVAGHGFMGAIPFITAAQMTDNWLLKGSLYACSTLTTWTRLHHDQHYLSQAILGWWMAYLACAAIDRTQREYSAVSFMPLASNDTVGFRMVCKY